MRKIFASALIVMVGLGNIAFAADDIPTRDVFVNISDAFIPTEQTVDQDALVVPSGMFPNSCYRMKSVEVKSKSEFEHEIKVVATVSQSMCLMVVSFWNKEVRLGRLSRGEHVVRFLNGDDTWFERKMVIK